jgi:hypothetical protein
MAKSRSKTTVSVLRSIIGISAKDLAELTGRSIHTIKSVESGRLALSEELAVKMSVETGVCARWLVNGEPQAPPLNDFPLPVGHPNSFFTKKYFEKRRADRMHGRDELNRLGGFSFLDAAKLCAIHEAAVKSGNGRVVQYRISKFLRELEKEFGQCEKTLGREIEMSQLWHDFGALFMYPGDGHDDKTDDEPKWAAAGEPAWANYREFVPSFKRAYAKLAEDSERRLEKGNPQDPGIFPLLRWALEAIRVFAPKRATQVITPKGEMGAPKARRRSAKSPRLTSSKRR